MRVLYHGHRDVSQVVAFETTSDVMVNIFDHSRILLEPTEDNIDECIELFDESVSQTLPICGDFHVLKHAFSTLIRGLGHAPDDMAIEMRKSILVANSVIYGTADDGRFMLYTADPGEPDRFDEYLKFHLDVADLSTMTTIGRA